MLAEAKADPGMVTLVQGRFRQTSDGNVVMFIESASSNRFHDIFLVQLHPRGSARPSVVVADSGELLQQKDGSQAVILNRGTCFEGTMVLHDFCIINFNSYQAIIGHQVVSTDPDGTEQMDMYILWKTHTDRTRTELHRCLALVATVLIMALTVAPLNVVNLHRGRVLSMLPTMPFYLVFFLLQTSIEPSGDGSKTDPVIRV